MALRPGVGAVHANTSHIERTSPQFRQTAYFLTRIENVRKVSPSVRLINLKIVPPFSSPIDGLPQHQCQDPRLFSFKPGQWIDTYVPHLPKPGGFSFVSAPKQFRETGIVSLAIQRTDNPPSVWLWKNDIAGQYIMIRVGGNFVFPPSNLPRLGDINYFQFIAGGVGINPLISMLQYIQQELVLPENSQIVLHYLVRSREDILFLDELHSLKDTFGNHFDGNIWITRKQSPSQVNDLATDTFLRFHTLAASTTSEVGESWDWWNSFSSHILEHLENRENGKKNLVYICGPQGLTDRLVDMYKERGMDTSDGHVQIEKWW